MCGLQAGARDMGSSTARRSGNMLRANCSTAPQPSLDFRWQQRIPSRNARYTEGPGPQHDLAVETSGCGVRLVIKGCFFVCLSDSPFRKPEERPASATRAGVNARRALQGILGGLDFREKCRLERFENREEQCV